MTITEIRVGNQRPRLSSLPADIANTDAGDEVIEFAERFGLVLDEWQRWVVRHMCAERADGSWAATQSVLLVPRQAGKGAVLEAIELAALFLWDYEHIIYSAHLQKTSTDHMRRVRRHITSTPDLDRQSRVLTGKGDERVERDTGAILEFLTRSKKTSRGGSPNMVIFDEALFLQEDEIQAMVPALAAQSMNEDAAAQMIYTSSAPTASSSVLHRLRTRGIEERPRRMFFAEWSVPGDADPADRDNWYAANPGLGIRISEEWVEDNEFGTLSPEAFLTERLGVPEDPVAGPGQAITAETWAALIDKKSTCDSHESWAVSMSINRTISLGLTGRRADGRLHVEHLLPDERLTVRDVIEAWRTKKLPLRVHKTGPEGSLIPVLVEAGVEVVEISSAEVAQATGYLIDSANGDDMRHLDQPLLTKAVAGAVLRMQTDGAVLWSQRNSLVEIPPLMACTVALTGVPVTRGEPMIYVWKGGAKA